MKDWIRKLLNMRTVQAALLVGAGLFVFSSTDVHFMIRSADRLPDIQNRLYQMQRYFLLTGYLIYAFLVGRLPVRAKKNVLAAAAVIFETAVISTFLTEDTGILVIVRGIAAICTSLLLACVYHTAAGLLDGSGRYGRSTAFAFLLAYGIQYPLILKNDSFTLHGLVLSGGMLLLILLLHYILSAPDGRKDAGTAAGADAFGNGESPAQAALPETGGQPAVPLRGYVLPWAMAAVFIFVEVYYNERMGWLSYESSFTEFNIYDWPRLFVIAGGFAAGFAADRKDGRFLPVFAALVSLMTVLNPLLFGTSRTEYLINMSLFYFSLGTTVAFCCIAFWKLAVRTSQPAFWAIQGRVVEILVEVVFSSVLLRLPTVGVVAVYLAAAAAGMVMAVVWMTEGTGEAVPGEPASVCADERTAERDGEAPREDDAEGRLCAFAERYGLTEREQAVMERLLTTEETGQQMADALFISRRVLQRHIASIYEKTGTKTRTGLIAFYYNS